MRTVGHQSVAPKFLCRNVLADTMGDSSDLQRRTDDRGGRTRPRPALVAKHDDVDVRLRVCEHRACVGRCALDGLRMNVLQQSCASFAIEGHNDVDPIATKCGDQLC